MRCPWEPWSRGHSLGHRWGEGCMGGTGPSSQLLRRQYEGHRVRPARPTEGTQSQPKQLRLCLKILTEQTYLSGDRNELNCGVRLPRG
ncbi:rCG35338 [Rattus norvegicus]|uniref:RCG35338 n=1 Tax=Rattus norvegicus TaxID=10116 RepID=A6HHN7_RAT|nr:rCG35338 [Rattus norvegicus]